MQLKSLIDLDSMAPGELAALLDLAADIKCHPEEYRDRARGRILATLFYEPSTRTQMSFQAAMLRLGGQVIGFDNPQVTSVAKGESLGDTIRVVSNYADVIAIRHPKAGAAYAADFYAHVPVINAGDGSHLHPTQTLTDLFTLRQEKGRITNLSIGCCGDLKNGRTAHSLIKAMSRYLGNRFVLVSTPELGVPHYIKDVLDAAGTPYIEMNSLEEAISLLDVLYMTRIQAERFGSAEEYGRQKGVFVLDKQKLRMAKRTLKVLHPLPRVDEIAEEVDSDPRAIYFAQTEYGMYVRMALLILLMEKTGKPAKTPKPTHLQRCANPDCITNTERYLPSIFFESGDMLVCDYCEERKLI